MNRGPTEVLLCVCTNYMPCRLASLFFLMFFFLPFFCRRCCCRCRLRLVVGAISSEDKNGDKNGGTDDGDDDDVIVAGGNCFKDAKGSRVLNLTSVLKDTDAMTQEVSALWETGAGGGGGVPFNL